MTGIHHMHTRQVQKRRLLLAQGRPGHSKLSLVMSQRRLSSPSRHVLLQCYHAANNHMLTDHEWATGAYTKKEKGPILALGKVVVGLLVAEARVGGQEDQ